MSCAYWRVDECRFGLAWNPAKAGHILGASEDMTVCLWDVNSYTKARNTLEPTTVYKGHTSVVGVSGPINVFDAGIDLFVRQDVDWHPTKENVFASVGDDKLLLLCVYTLVLESCHAYT